MIMIPVISCYCTFKYNSVSAHIDETLVLINVLDFIEQDFQDQWLTPTLLLCGSECYHLHHHPVSVTAGREHQTHECPLSHTHLPVFLCTGRLPQCVVCVLAGEGTDGQSRRKLFYGGRKDCISLWSHKHTHTHTPVLVLLFKVIKQ